MVRMFLLISASLLCFAMPVLAQDSKMQPSKIESGKSAMSSTSESMIESEPNIKNTSPLNPTAEVNRATDTVSSRVSESVFLVQAKVYESVLQMHLKSGPDM